MADKKGIPAKKKNELTVIARDSADVPAAIARTWTSPGVLAASTIYGCTAFKQHDSDLNSLVEQTFGGLACGRGLAPMLRVLDNQYGRNEMNICRIVGFVCLFIGTTAALAQGFTGNNYVNMPNFSTNLGVPIPTGFAPDVSTDLVGMGRSNPAGGPGSYFSAYLPLSSFASSADVASIGANISSLSERVERSIQRANGGIAAVAAMGNASMPSAPGRTAWAINGATFLGKHAGGLSVSHRLNFGPPVAVTAAYGRASSDAHAARIGLMGEF